MVILSVTGRAPINIAVVKYWGKKDERLILPLNGSISGTLDLTHMCATTTVAISESFSEDQFWLNGLECSLSARFSIVLEAIKKRALENETIDREKLSWKIHICSKNNFPTAAGLASSAAGLACLVFCLARLYNIDGDVSGIARLGSGSACRSMYGGFVEWMVGECRDGRDSVAKQIIPANHWPNMAVLILVVNAGRKHTSSTSGMQTSVQTSRLLEHRAKLVVPDHIDLMRGALLQKDFQTFAQVTMKDSNSMHAVCMDTYPPIHYLTHVSHHIINLVHSINNYFRTCKVAYTFDAGPNACLYLLDDDLPTILSLIRYFYPKIQNVEEGGTDDDACRDGDVDEFVRGRKVKVDAVNEELINSMNITVLPGALSYVISTKIGDGPVLLSADDSLLNLETGLPHGELL
ncbi:hypothetical protein HELRODRAFT_185177 [Helobdella robusta]|uniref:Diphosphomevalonate decarboxylase n=1 Tax=Helobdella robusta TaxID=6412 RepID=T1FMH1_HELRO|nr:hypothetical protein HELRODRAFT_185177 [Helobdella robusta]ESN93109.1 hypothetical protein HELRODRAFT_185177 [Helobdella robusta]